jgi:hypothetical protein
MDKIHLSPLVDQIQLTLRAYFQHPIFRKVPIYDHLVKSRHKSIWLPNNTFKNSAIAAPHLLRLSTGVARPTSPRRLILAGESKNTSKNKEECNTIADV